MKNNAKKISLQNYLPEEPSTSSATAAGEGESTENHISIMGLVDEAKKRLNAEITEQHNRNTANAKTSLVFCFFFV